MTVQELFRAGELKQAILALGAEVRDRPSDSQRRTFLFELLCFAGDYSRAEKQLNILADGHPDRQTGALVCRSAIVAERKRQEFFETRQYEQQAALEPQSRPGKLNGEAFHTIEDADPRIGPRLEMYLAGEYLWLPFDNVGWLTVPPPRLLRDLLWTPAEIRGSKPLAEKDFGEVLLPALYPLSWQQPKDSVKLGRETDWAGDTPYGQKLLVLDGEKVVPFLEVRTLEFDDSQVDSPSDGE